MSDGGQSGNPAGDRILEALSREGRTLGWLARQTGLSPSTVSDYVRKGLPGPVDAVARIAKSLGMSMDAIVGGGDAGPISRPSSEKSATVDVPVYDVDVAAGAGRTIDDQLGAPTFCWTFPRQWAEANLRNLDALRIFYVTGDSQEPELSQDDLVAVDTSVRRLREGRLFVVRIEDQLVAKRIQMLGSRVRLISRNDAYPPVDINIQEAGAGFDVVGEVVWASKMF